MSKALFCQTTAQLCSAFVVDTVKLVVYGAAGAGAGVDSGGQIGGDKIVTEYLGHLNHF